MEEHNLLDYSEEQIQRDIVECSSTVKEVSQTLKDVQFSVLELMTAMAKIQHWTERLPAMETMIGELVKNSEKKSRCIYCPTNNKVRSNSS